MPRQPSEKTQLLNCKRQITALQREIGNLVQYKKTLNGEIEHFRGRATKAEQEAAEWRARFDALFKHMAPKP